MEAAEEVNEEGRAPKTLGGPAASMTRVGIAIVNDVSRSDLAVIARALDGVTHIRSRGVPQEGHPKPCIAPLGSVNVPRGQVEEPLLLWIDSGRIGGVSARRSCSGVHNQRNGGAVSHWSQSHGNVARSCVGGARWRCKGDISWHRRRECPRATLRRVGTRSEAWARALAGACCSEQMRGR